jgi:hypothetical protein
VTARTRLGRTLAAALSIALSQVSLPAAAAAEHLVDPGTLARRLLASAQTREQRIALFQQALARPEVRQQAHTMGVSADRISRALPHLSDAELADLSARAERVKDVTAGHSSNDGVVILGITLLVVALVVLLAVSYDDYYDCYCY